MSSKSLRTRTNLFLVLVVALNPLGNAFLREGMDRTGAPARWTPHALVIFFGKAFQSGSVWLGICFLTLFFICYMLVLSWADYSYVLPASAGSYVVVALLGSTLLGEHVPIERWIGIGLISVGAVLVGRTSPASGPASGREN
jgi:drug/metabolite transporter (DMT)-like permease